ncbi:unnamed protein product [Soboliphyme baturini]|uniref:V-SNARE coiled-coil homology domain-containing protein n=1 Tax=Soboliphyme baturini TaxID=241478 RepID=A0A183J3I4_9BILA|nr:unnamed protein product [Soboliphyme baturini]
MLRQEVEMENIKTVHDGGNNLDEFENKFGSSSQHMREAVVIQVPLSASCSILCKAAEDQNETSFRK